jgi:hypothetical protein
MLMIHKARRINPTTAMPRIESKPVMMRSP